MSTTPEKVSGGGLSEDGELGVGPSSAEASHAHHASRVRHFYRTTLFQILVVSLCAFCAPGVWSAMNGLGVGGSQSPNLVNAANALLYAFMTITCFLGPWLTNLIGFRWTLALGAIGYPLYAAGLYMNNRWGNTWLVVGDKNRFPLSIFSLSL